jgi:hypothetical protein
VPLALLETLAVAATVVGQKAGDPKILFQSGRSLVYLS